MNATAATTADRAPGWFRLAAALALLWTLFGVYTYLAHVGIVGDGTSGMSEAERMLAESTPTWVTAAYAIAVFAGALGSLGLLLLKRWARPLLIVSLIAVIIQEGWVLFLSGAAAVHGPSAIILPLVILLVGVLLVWLADRGTKAGWLR